MDPNWNLSRCWRTFHIKIHGLGTVEAIICGLGLDHGFTCLALASRVPALTLRVVVIGHGLRILALTTSPTMTHLCNSFITIT